MNREETKEAIKVMQAFVDGKKIKNQYKDLLENPVWDWNNYRYNIIDEQKQPTTHRPFKNEEEFEPFFDKRVIYKNTGDVYRISGFGNSGVIVGIVKNTWDEFFEYYTFYDGSPCGISTIIGKTCQTCKHVDVLYNKYPCNICSQNNHGLWKPK